MKRLIGVGTGVIALSGFLVAGCASKPQPAAQATPAAGTAAPAMVSCGDGRQAFVQQVNGVALVQCAPLLAADSNQVLAYVPQAGTAPAVQDAAYREPVAQAARPASYGTDLPRRTYPRERVYVRRGRTWKKSAVIIGGSTAAGAGVGAVLGGGSGAKKGAVIGLIGGTVYDIATRNR